MYVYAAHMQSLGQVGCVVKRAESGRKVHATVNGKRWIYDAKCLTPAPEEELPLMINDGMQEHTFRAQHLDCMCIVYVM